MKLLALDTASENCSAALWADGYITLIERELDRGHAAEILPMIDQLLRDAALELGAIDAIGYGRGPGSFTGVRLACSVVQGLAYGARLPVVPVSDLRALAQRALGLDPQCPWQRVLVCGDARMHEIYWAAYERGEEGLAVQCSGARERVDPAATVAADASKLLQVEGASSWCGAGRGFRAYPELRALLGLAGGQIYDELLPSAADIARLAVSDFARGLAVGAASALPVYLRDDVATAVPRR